MCHLQQLSCNWQGCTRRYNQVSRCRTVFRPSCWYEVMGKFLHSFFKTGQRTFLLMTVLFLGLLGVSLPALAADPISVSVAVVDDKGQPVPVAEAQLKAGDKV